MHNRFGYASRCLPQYPQLSRPHLSHTSFLHRNSSFATAPPPSLLTPKERSALEYTQLIHAFEAPKAGQDALESIDCGTKEARDGFTDFKENHDPTIRRRVSKNFRFRGRQASHLTKLNDRNTPSPSPMEKYLSTNCRAPIRNKAASPVLGGERTRRKTKALHHRSKLSTRRRRAPRTITVRAFTQRFWKCSGSERNTVHTRHVSLNAWSHGSQDFATGAAPQSHEWSLDGYDEVWSAKFSRLNDGHRLELELTPHITYLLERYAGLSRNGHLRPRVLFDIEKQAWQDTILWCLQNSPMRALNFLVATIGGRRFRPPRHMVEDCLHFLSRHYLYRVSTPGASAMHALWHLTRQFVDGVTAADLRAYSIPQSLVRLLLKYGNDAQTLSFYDLLIFNRISMHANTMLHFLEKFANMGRSDLAMKLLARIANSDFPLSRDQIQRACVRLLRTRWDVDEPYAIQTKVLTQMLEMGIKPNTHMYNAILLNMIEAHDFDTAWQTYDIAKRNNFVTDSITCGILVKGATLSGNANILDLVFRETSEGPRKLQDLRLVSDILNTIYVFSPGNEYPSMLKFYKQHCDLRPLQELGLCEPETKPPASKDVVGATPTKFILGQMILAYNKFRPSSNGLIYRYNLYHDFVRQNHPVIAPLAREDYVANSFILAFGKRSETLQHCTTVVRHMLESPPSPNQPPYAVPTVRTWSVLASSYFRHNQRLAAEKVFSMMRERGLRPDKVTWNTMVSGYAALQDVEAAVGAMKRMEAAGYEVNDYTLKGLGKIWDRSRLLEALKKGISEDWPVQKDISATKGSLSLSVVKEEGSRK